MTMHRRTLITSGLTTAALLSTFSGSAWAQGRPIRLVVPYAAGGPIDVKNALLWGGNLAVVCALTGTPWLPDVRGGVLFLEDVHEHPYRIERMLTQLLHAGVLGRQKAIVLGQFTNIRLVPHDRGFKLGTVVKWLQSQLKIPVLTGLPFGHVPTKVLLPVGAKVHLNADEREALIYWGD